MPTASSVKPLDTPKKVLKVAVVGHTNTGKTSLIRTLLRDDRFGDVDDAAGTTRRVEKISIFAEDLEVLTLYDTPGFEDASALLQELEQLEVKHGQTSPAALLRKFLDHANDHPEFEQENKVLLQALRSDVLLYLVDVREPLLGKYKDEVNILSRAGKPIIPVFNFIAANEDALAKWREYMAQFNLHAALEFDTVAFDFEAEKRLYQKLQSLLEPHYEAIQTLIDYRQRVWRDLSQAAARRIFHMLTEVACYRLEIESESEDAIGASSSSANTMQNYVRRAEQRTLRDLLAIFSFTQLDLELQKLPVQDGEWELDVFSPNALKAFGQNASASALTGAAAGAGFDLMVGGISLGAATMVGAALGAGLATARRYRDELRAAWRGNKWLCVDENTLRILFLRQRELLHILTQRGHAAVSKVELGNKSAYKLPRDWLKVVERLRQNPQWRDNKSSDPGYKDIANIVTRWLLEDAA